MVTGLDKENFQIYEDKEKQTVSYLFAQYTPVSLGIIFDTSASMTTKMEKAREAVIEFLRGANAQDEFFMVTFGDAPKEICDFTRSLEDIQNALVYGVPRGSTALLDAVYLGISQMQRAQHARRALLVISDGGDNHIRYTEREVRLALREADTLVYGIGIYDRYFATDEERFGPILLADLSEETGGRMFPIDNPNDLAEVARKISFELRNQYVLGYRPSTSKLDGKWHEIKVKVILPRALRRLQVHARRGYYAPPR